MNKKRLSVVMAGAMLASSVAPVLAAEVQKSEHSANELGLLQEELRNLVESKVYSDVAENAPARKHDYRNESVYAIYVNGTNTGLDVNSTTNDWQRVFNDLNEGDKVNVYSKGFKEDEATKVVYAYETIKGGEIVTYTKEDELKEFVGNFYEAGGFEHDDQTDMKAQYTGFIEFAKYDALSKEAVVKFKPDTNIAGIDEQDTLRISVNSKQPKFKYVANGIHDIDTTYPTYFYIKSDKTEAPLVANDIIQPKEFYGFVLSGERTQDKPAQKIASSTLREITITAGGYNFNVSDLYDGLFLTEKGNEFFGLLKDSIAAKRTVNIRVNDNLVLQSGSSIYTEGYIKTVEGQIKGQLKEYNKIYKFEVELLADGQLKREVYTITGKDKAEVARLASWMLRPQARVDKFEGSNRYETAALIAREYAGLTRKSVNETIKPIAPGKDVNIVLVNGNALVDGLAAAPLAATKANTVRDNQGRDVKVSAPVLLTEAGRLPRETKAYLREVLSNVAVGDLPKVTINLVGGETVLTKDLERELKAIGYHGFKVERFGGENREATSLEVAKEIDSDNAFVVGGEGEADAMSIAAVAAEQKTPIIVAKKGGISEDGVYAVRDKDVMIVGGKAVVSEADEKEIRTEATSVNRVFGANRKATNAEVIKRYYNTAGFADGVGNAQNVIVAKDGQRNKTELVDALAAANMASEKKAPIVLATDNLSKEQETAINSYANDAYGLFQVGVGVNREVVRKIAVMLNLTNR